MKRIRLVLTVLLLIFLYNLAYQSWDNNIENKTSQHFSDDNLTNKEILLKDIGIQAYASIDDLNLKPGLKIEFLGIQTKDNYSELIRQGAETAIKDINKKLGYKKGDKIKLIYNETQVDINDQVNLFDEVLSQRPDGIIINISDKDAFGAQFDIARDSSIPIVSVDGTSTNDNVLVRVNNNNYSEGQLLAEKLNNLVTDEANIIMLSSNDSPLSLLEKEQGFIDAVTNNYKNINIFRRLHINKLKGELLNYGEDISNMESNVKDVINQYIQQNNIKAVVCFDGDSTAVCIDNLSSQDRQYNILGVNDASNIKSDITEEKIDGIVLENPYAMGYASVVALIRGILTDPNESNVNIRNYYIDKDNIESDEIKPILTLWEN